MGHGAVDSSLVSTTGGFPSDIKSLASVVASASRDKDGPALHPKPDTLLILGLSASSFPLSHWFKYRSLQRGMFKAQHLSLPI